MKSLLSGAFVGVLSGGVAVGVASLIAPQPAGNAPPDAPQVQAPAAVAEAPQPEQTIPEITNTDSEQTAASPAPNGLSPVDQSVLPEADTTPPDVPVAQEVETALVVPDSSSAPTVDTAAENPVLPNPQSIAPQIPAAEEDLVISTQPAAPVVADAPVVVADAEEQPAPVIVAEPDAPVVAEPEAPVVEDVPEEDVVASAEAPDIPEPSADPLVPPQIETEDTPTPVEVEPAPETSVVPTLETPELGESGPTIVGADPVAPVTTVPDTTVTETPDPGPAPAVVTLVDDEAAPELPTGTGGVVVNRSLGNSNSTDQEDEAAQEPTAVVDPDTPAIVRYAAAFDNAASKPTMSLVIIDDGDLKGGVAALENVPFPVTVALDPTAAGASDAMAAYRAAGIEVALLAKLPVGAQPSDVEVALAAAFAALPETVIMVDTGEGNLQADRAVMAQAMAALAEDGRGLLTVSQGLNAGLQIAADNGVPAGLIFRDLDGDDQNERVIGRFLDQAAFRARQESGVVLLARMRPETLNALISWGNANRAGQVAMAPISAVLDTDG